MLNSDIDEHIFKFLPISDKRSFIRTCKIIHQFSIHMPQIESVFQKMINDSHFLHGYHYSGFYYPLYKYTIELLYNNHLIPHKYISPNNRILYQYSKIYKILGQRKNLDLIIKLFNCNGLSKKNADFIMRGAAEVGDIEILKWVKKQYPFSQRTAAHAAKGNQIETLRWLIQNDCCINEFAKYYAAGEGNLDIFKYLVNELKLRPDGCGYYAGLGEHMDVLKFIYSCDPYSLYQACDGAAERGNLDILKYGYEHGTWLNDYFSCTHIHIFDWLIDNNHIQPDIKISMRIAWTGDLECLQYIYSKGFPVLHKKVFTKAIDGRNIKMIKWLHNMECPIADSATETATDYPSAEAKIGGDVNILKLLVGWGCKLPQKIDCVDPARHGDLEMLKFLHSHGGVLDIEVMDTAAEYGHLHIIIWAREQGCKWNTSTCGSTILYNHIYVLKWLRGIDRNKCNLRYTETDICPWNEKICLYAIRYEHVNILKFAIDEGCKCEKKSYLAAMNQPNNVIRDIVTSHYSLHKPSL